MWGEEGGGRIKELREGEGKREGGKIGEGRGGGKVGNDEEQRLWKLFHLPNIYANLIAAIKTFCNIFNTTLWYFVTQVIQVIQVILVMNVL